MVKIKIFYIVVASILLKKGSELKEKKTTKYSENNGKAFRYTRIKVRFCCVTETLMGGTGNTGKKKITFLFLAVFLQEIKNKAKGMGF